MMEESTPLLSNKHETKTTVKRGGNHIAMKVHSRDNISSALSRNNKRQDNQNQVTMIVNISFAANIILLVVKMYAVYMTHSLSVIGSLIDSIVDVIAQIIVLLANQDSTQVDRVEYPAGKGRLEPAAIIVCASIMGTASLQLVFTSTNELIDGFMHHSSTNVVVFDWLSMSLVFGTIVLKLILFIVCASMSNKSSTVKALVSDHRNDVVSNAVAIVTGYMASNWRKTLWYLDPTGAILISIYICWNWTEIAMEQVEFIVGKSSAPEYIEKYKHMGNNFHELMYVDIVRCYHFGSRYLVEVEVVLPEHMPVRESHDIALALQMSLEAEEEVERAFVHVDYMSRKEDEHDWLSYQEQAARLGEEKQSIQFHESEAKKHREILERLSS